MVRNMMEEPEIQCENRREKAVNWLSSTATRPAAIVDSINDVDIEKGNLLQQKSISAGVLLDKSLALVWRFASSLRHCAARPSDGG
jgi:hypothetical protein